MSSQYFVKSFYAASYLKSLGYEPQIEVSPQGQSVFWYERTPGLENLVKEFFDNEELQAFVRGQLGLKKLMFEGNKTPTEET
ncbi:MAG: DUF5659 domain-containing protein [Oscillospiraceae bacterium]|nr:DUF5659 domain-containing protein [Oscillospiraceae bacterium]